MAWTHIGSVAASSSNNHSILTGAIDTTSADLLVAVVGEYTVNANAVLTDSKGNTWTALTSYQASSQDRITIWYARPTVGGFVGPAHTFTITDATSTIPSISVTAWSGSATAPLDQQTGNTSASGTTCATGAITPSTVGSLVITGFTAAIDAGSNPTVGSSYTILANAVAASSLAVSSAIAYLITGGTSTNPTWTNPTGSSSAAEIVSFRPAAATGVVRPTIGVGYLVQAGTNLWSMTAAGVATAITIPNGVTVTGSTQPCRPVVFSTGTDPIIVIVNGASRDFFIDRTGAARRLQLVAPGLAPTTAVGSGTGLTGNYSVAASYKIKDYTTGQTLLESGISPLSTALSLTNQSIGLASIPVSADDACNARGLYRTLSGGNVLYPWFDIDNNSTLVEDRAGADALLSLTPAAAVRYNAPPNLKLICTWRERLWGCPRTKIDYVRWTDDRKFYAWSADNELVVPPQQTDVFGVTAFLPRRDALGVARRRRLYMIVGTSNDSFQRVGISESLGCVSQESVVIVNNVAYMLGESSVNEWSDNGVMAVSDTQVAAWFNSDVYFNRAMFPYAQGRYNLDTKSYELTVALAGSTTLDHWVSYNLTTRTWMGPHKTDAAFTPVCCGTTSALYGTLSDANAMQIAVFGGSDGYLYRRDTTTVNDQGIPVALSVDLPPLSANEPDFMKMFSSPTIHTRAESQGTMTITPTVGNLVDTASAALTHDLTLDRERLDRLGAGRYCQLNLSHSSTTERPRIYGIEIPFVVVGRR